MTRRFLWAFSMFCASVLSLSFSRGERMATTNCQARDNQEVQVSSIYREHPVTASNKQRYSLYQDMLPQRLAPTPNSPCNRNGQQSSAHHYRSIGSRRFTPDRYPNPEQMVGYGNKLAPLISNALAVHATIVGEPTDPNRFSDFDLLEREASYGRSGFALQFMFDTRLSDAERYPPSRCLT